MPKLHENTKLGSGKVERLDHLDDERVVLGQILIETTAIHEVVDLLSPHHFDLASHQAIYRAIFALWQAGNIIDLITVRRQMEAHGTLEKIGGSVALGEPTTYAANWKHLRKHAVVILDHYLRRRVLQMGHTIQQAAEDPAQSGIALKLLAEEQALNLDDVAESKRVVNAADCIVALIEKLHRPGAHISTGFSDLDKLVKGFEAGKLYVVAGRAGIGKTSFMLSMLGHQCIINQTPAVYFSLEMTKEEIIAWLAVAEGIFDMGKQRHTTEDFKRLLKEGKRLGNAPLHVIDHASPCMGEIASTLRRLKKQKKAAIVYIDHLHLLQPPSNLARATRDLQLAWVTRHLKIMAKELALPIILGAQLNRKAEDGRQDPRLSHLRDSGAIEQDADVVMMLHRMDYYGLEVDERGESIMGKTDLFVRKNRGLDTGKIKLQYRAQEKRYYMTS